MLPPFFVWQKRVLRKINPEDVIALEAKGNYTKIYVSKTSYMVRSSLSRTLSQLPDDMFIKIHRSHAVSVFYIDKISSGHLVIGRTSIPVGRKFYKSVLEQLTIIGSKEEE